MLRRCRQLEARVLGGLTPTDRDALLQLMHITPAPKPMVATGQTTLTPPTTSAHTAGPTRSSGLNSPQITKSGLHSTSLVWPVRPRHPRKFHQVARRIDSSTRRDPTAPCLHPSAKGSMLTTGSAILMYARLHFPFIICSMIAKHEHSMDSLWF